MRTYCSDSSRKPKAGTWGIVQLCMNPAYEKQHFAFP